MCAGSGAEEVKKGRVTEAASRAAAEWYVCCLPVMYICRKPTTYSHLHLQLMMSKVGARLHLAEKKVSKKADDLVWSSFAVGYEQAWAYYNDDKLKECIRECNDLLDHGATIPRYIRIATLILLCLVVRHKADFDEARAEARTSIT